MFRYSRLAITRFAAGAVLVGAWLGVAMDGTVFPLTLTVGAMSVATAAVAWTLVQRHGDPRPIAAVQAA